MRRFLSVAFVLLWVSTLTAAQHSGEVRSDGQPIPGATVTATQGGHKILTITDEGGRYTFDGLAPGTWIFEVEMFGFTTAHREVNVAADGSSLKWDLELKAQEASSPQPAAARQQGSLRALSLSQSAESQVTAALAAASAPVLSANESPADANEAFLVSGSLSRGLQAVQAVDPMEQRRAEFRRRMPGGSPGGDVAGLPGFSGSSSDSPGPRLGPGGGRFGGRGGFSPRAGRGGGGPRGGRRPPWARRRGVANFGNRINRGSGRRSFRGAVFFSLRNSALDARPYSLTGQTVEKPSYARTRFGIVGGGQLRIPKLINSERTFFFVNYFGTRSRNPYSAVSTVPTQLERNGDFSQSIAQGPVAIFDPTSQLPFPGNRVPLDRMDPAARGLLDFIPLPNQPGKVQNYQFITSVPQNTNNFGLRLNHNLSQRDRLSGNFNLQARDSENAQLYGFRDETNGRGFSLRMGWTHNITPRLISSLRWSFSRNRSETVPFFAFQENVAARLGIEGTSQDPINYGPPNLTFTNFGNLVDASPSLRRDQTSGVSEGITLVRGSHTFTAGGEYRRTQLNQRTEQNARGNFNFSGLLTSSFDQRGQPLAGTGFDFADFLLGFPQSSSVRFGSADNYFRGSVYSAYVQDDWRIRSNLTLNLGLRYEFFQPLREKFGRIANLDIAPGFTGVAVVTPGGIGPYSGQFPDGLIDSDLNNFSPRVGIAWRPFSKSQFLVRAGYGLFYNGSIYRQFPNRLASQPPFADTATLSTSVVQPLTLQNGFATSPSTTVTNTYAVDRHYRVPYAQTWNFALQQQLLPSVVVELGYLGTKGTRLDIQRLPNRAAPGSPLTAEERRQIGNAVGFTLDSSEGNSIYHAGQVRVTRRFRRGLSANALYTWSKSIDNASTFGGAGAVVAQDDEDLSAERGLSSFDRRHTLDLFYVLTSSFGPRGSQMQASGWPGRLLQDWTLSGGVTIRSGPPLTARVLGNRSDSGGTGSVGSGRADATGVPVDPAGVFFNTAAFTVPPPGRFGNAGRNTIPGPGLFSLNLSLARNIRIGGERRNLQVRLEAANLTNHVSFTNLGTVVNASDYGLPTAAASMRTISMSLRYRF